MSALVSWIAPAIPAGRGWALDIGGGAGELQRTLEAKGYGYVNVDLHPSGPRTVRADAHRLPFLNGSIDLVVAKDALEHFEHPWQAVDEMYRVLRQGGYVILWVPFMHPFHSNDLYRYTPLALTRMFKDFTLIRLESPLWLFSLLALPLAEACNRLRAQFLLRPVRTVAYWMDRLILHGRPGPRSLAVAYLLVAMKSGP